MIAAMEMARQVIDSRFEAVTAAILGGSAATGRWTSTSDLDLVVLVDNLTGSYRETVSHGGRPVELFVYGPRELRHWWDLDALGRRDTLANMCAHGLVVVDGGGAGAAIQAEATTFLAAGPAALLPAERDRRRYQLTDALDDLTGGLTAAEQAAVAGQVFFQAAELALIHAGVWLAQGKWLVRRLQQHDHQLAENLLTGYRRATAGQDVADLVEVVDAVLNRVGGRLLIGYRVG